MRSMIRPFLLNNVRLSPTPLALCRLPLRSGPIGPWRSSAGTDRPKDRQQCHQCACVDRHTRTTPPPSVRRPHASGSGPRSSHRHRHLRRWLGAAPPDVATATETTTKALAADLRGDSPSGSTIAIQHYTWRTPNRGRRPCRVRPEDHPGLDLRQHLHPLLASGLSHVMHRGVRRRHRLGGAGSSRSDKSGAPFSSRPSTPTVSLGGSRPASRTSPVGVAAGGRGLRAVRRRRDHPGPGPDRIRRTCTADALYGTRVLVETSMGPSATDCRCGGIPYLGAFDDPSAQDYLVLRRAGPLGAAHGRQVPPPPEAMEPWRVCPRQVLSGVGALMGTPKSRGT